MVAVIALGSIYAAFEHHLQVKVANVSLFSSLQQWWWTRCTPCLARRRCQHGTSVMNLALVLPRMTSSSTINPSFNPTIKCKCSSQNNIVCHVDCLEDTL